MVDNIYMSKRLKLLASFIDKDSFFADIGTDHAYLPCFICLQYPNARAIAGEVNKGPLERAQETVMQYDLNSRISVRQGNGLDVIHSDDAVDTVIISGMGGPLITSILCAGNTTLQHIPKIIAQPNNHAIHVRRFFMKNQYEIVDEQITEENGHTYEIIIGKKNPFLDENYLGEETEKMLLFGPKLIKEKSPIFIKKWQAEKDKLTQVMQQMEQATIRDEKKIITFQQQLHWMKEVLS